MTDEQFRRYKRYVWLGNIFALLLLIGVIITGWLNDNLYYIFLSEEFSKKYLHSSWPMILYLCGVAFAFILANLEVFYEERNMREMAGGEYEVKERLRSKTERKVRRSVTVITAVNFLVVGFLIYNLLKPKIYIPFAEEIMIIGLIILVINIGLTIGMALTKK